MAEGPLGAVKFQRPSLSVLSDGSVSQTVAEEFGVDRMSLSYRTMSYTRWHAFREQILKEAIPMAPLLPAPPSPGRSGTPFYVTAGIWAVKYRHGP